jgi:hypothetical protein
MKTEFTKDGFRHEQLMRSGQIALFERWKPDQPVHYEVVRIREHKAYKLGTAEIPAGEHYPSTSSWGTDGFTYRDEADAVAKYRQLCATASDDLAGGAA